MFDKGIKIYKNAREKRNCADQIGKTTSYPNGKDFTIRIKEMRTGRELIR